MPRGQKNKTEAVLITNSRKTLKKLSTSKNLKKKKKRPHIFGILRMLLPLLKNNGLSLLGLRRCHIVNWQLPVMSIRGQFLVGILCCCLSTYLCEYSILSFWRERTAVCWVTWTVTLCHIKCPLRVKEVQDKTRDLSLETHILVRTLPFKLGSPCLNPIPPLNFFLSEMLIKTSLIVKTCWAEAEYPTERLLGKKC